MCTSPYPRFYVPFRHAVAPEAHEGFGQGVMVLVATAARLLWPDTSGEALPWELQQLVRQGLGIAAICAACNHKDVALSALSCVDGLVGECWPEVRQICLAPCACFLFGLSGCRMCVCRFSAHNFSSHQ